MPKLTVSPVWNQVSRAAQSPRLFACLIGVLTNHRIQGLLRVSFVSSSEDVMPSL